MICSVFPLFLPSIASLGLDGLDSDFGALGVPRWFDFVRFVPIRVKGWKKVLKATSK
ncbi:hypothetical protein Hanom_Chr05g00450431 [Helianthus anomalus]